MALTPGKQRQVFFGVVVVSVTIPEINKSIMWVHLKNPNRMLHSPAEMKDILPRIRSFNGDILVIDGLFKTNDDVLFALEVADNYSRQKVFQSLRSKWTSNLIGWRKQIRVHQSSILEFRGLFSSGPKSILLGFCKGNL